MIVPPLELTILPERRSTAIIPLLALLPGRRLGPYEVEAAVGAGGMGEVYRARDTRLDRAVAIKVLAASLAGPPEVRERFAREARAISALNHPHFCTLYDVGHDHGVDYLVMEYLDGEPLNRRISGRPLPIAQLLDLAIDIADALEVAHASGILHRDSSRRTCSSPRAAR